MGNRTDTFNRADNSSALGTPSDAGGGWTVGGAYNPGILSNQAATYSGMGVAWLDAAIADAVVQITIVGGASPGLIARVADINNYLLWRHQGAGTSYDLYKCVGGSFTSLASGLGTAAANDVVKLDCSGSTLKAYLNGSLLTTQTDGAGSTNTKWGFSERSAAGIWDDFTVTGATVNSAFTAAATAGPATASASFTAAAPGNSTFTGAATAGPATASASFTVAAPGNSSFTAAAMSGPATAAASFAAAAPGNSAFTGTAAAGPASASASFTTAVAGASVFTAAATAGPAATAASFTTAASGANVFIASATAGPASVLASFTAMATATGIYFAPTYFAPTYFAPDYWPGVVGTPTPTPTPTYRNLFEALRERVLSGEPRLTDCYRRVPPDKYFEYPYAIYNDLNESPVWVSQINVYPSWVQVQITIVSPDDEEAEDLRDSCYLLFTGKRETDGTPSNPPLVFADGGNPPFGFNPGLKTQFRSPGRSAQGRPLWQFSFALQLFVTRGM